MPADARETGADCDDIVGPAGSTDQVRVMGVLNITPDSFSDGGRFLGLDAARDHAETLVREGADLIDVGGYSSRPGALDVPIDEEHRRVEPVLEAIASDLPGVPVSIDTFRPSVARAAIERGASIVNDITGGRDPELVGVAAELGVGYVVMHMQGVPRTMQHSPAYDDVVAEVGAYLGERVAAVRASGVGEVWADPGFGFGKELHHNYELMARLDEVAAAAGAPVLVGISRKRMLSRALEADIHGVGPGMAAAHLVAIQKGAAMLRVHDVADARQVIRIAELVAAAAR